MKKTILAAVLSVSMGLLSCAQAETVSKCGALQGHWVFYADASGHMMKHQSVPGYEQFVSKAQAAQQLMLRIRQVAAEQAPEKMSLYSVAPFAQLASEENVRDVDWESILKNRYNIKREVFARPDVFGERAITHFANQKAQQKAAFFIVDGEMKNAEQLRLSLEDFKRFNPKVNCYVLSLADTPQAKSRVAELARAMQAVEVDAWSLATDDLKLKRFVEEHLLADCVLSLNGIHFRFDKSDISEAGQAVLTKNLEYLSQLKSNQTVVIDGWTDNYGSDAYNAGLSNRRAQSVQRWLVEHGIDSEQVKAQGQGISHKFDNQTREGRAKNRRIDISIETK